ncbi:CBL-interacting serine/threonine-protein kinase 24 [Astathelohania contejeani]|uniref:non-specific serine/threonine protein kinase n=1 Tax=Astathelohania contejeani TaxID=164912 RepID=A0ABQ7HVS4_9MICR|nr:CBL-interacting serine/threonine-protein kinase 24 [Thelohania contejeani]
MLCLKKILRSIKKVFLSRKIVDPDDPNKYFRVLNVILHDSENSISEVICDQFKNVRILKKIKRKDMDDHQYSKRAHNEYLIYKALNSKYFPIFYHIYYIKSSYYLIYEFVASTPFMYIQSDDLLIRPLINGYFKQLILGISYLHNKGIVHNSLSTGNILIDSNGNLVIMGLENAEIIKITGECKFDWSYKRHGPHDFIAPELYKDIFYDGRSGDVWRCGIIFFYMLFRSFPWKQAVTCDEKYNMWIKLNYNHEIYLNNINIEIKWIFKRMLDPNPATRIIINDIKKLSWFKKIFVQNEYQ